MEQVLKHKLVLSQASGHVTVLCALWGVHLLPFLALAINRVPLNSGLSIEHMCCNVLLPAHAFLSGLGNIPVTRIGDHPSPTEEQSLTWVGAPTVVWSVTPLLVMILESLASVHQLVPTYWPHQGRIPHIGWRDGMLLSSSFSGQKLFLILNQKNCMVSLGNWHSFVLLLQDNELLLEAWKLGFRLCNFRVSLC